MRDEGNYNEEQKFIAQSVGNIPIVVMYFIYLFFLLEWKVKEKYLTVDYF